jgi:hypothetical protein
MVPTSGIEWHLRIARLRAHICFVGPAAEFDTLSSEALIQLGSSLMKVLGFAADLSYIAVLTHRRLS